MHAARRTTGRGLGLLMITALTFSACSEGDDASSPTQPTSDTATMAIDVEGLPDGVECSIGITGPEGYSQTVTDDTTLTGLEPGLYGVTISRPIDGYLQYEPGQQAMTLTLVAGETTAVDVVYSANVARGHLEIDVRGLPNGLDGSVLVTGPFDFSRSLTAGETFESVRPGNYTITSTAVTDGQFAYVPDVASANATVVAGATATGDVNYTTQELGIVDFEVTGIEIIQAVQRATADVPLIRSRAGLLRVYMQGSGDLFAVPTVGLEIAVNGTIVATPVLTPDYAEVPESTDRGDLTSSVNWTIPAEFVQPGLEIRATVDPDGAIPESDEANNAHPSAATRQSFPVASVDPYGITLIPVRQSANGRTGDVDASNADDYTSVAATIFPVPSVDVTVRATYTTDAPVLQSNDSNGAWGTVLTEIQTLRGTDGSDDNYYGVVETTYNSGVAGLGYVPSSRSSSYRASIGWDRANSRNGVAAHELGHNLGRFHGPCGGAANADANYPYGNGLIGQWGYNASAGTLVDPTSAKDIMTYCNPQWISDYNFELILDFLDAPVNNRVVDASPQPCLLVWGRIDDGEITLEPAAVVRARPQMPTRAGDYRVEIVRDTGHVLADFRFDPPPVGCAQGEPSSFVWYVPLDDTLAGDVAAVAVSGRGHSAVQEARTPDVTVARRVTRVLDRTGARTASLRWDASTLPLAIVRDARDGTVIGIGRRGDFEFVTDASTVDVVFSDGARSLSWSQRLD